MDQGRPLASGAKMTFLLSKGSGVCVMQLLILPVKGRESCGEKYREPLVSDTV